MAALPVSRSWPGMPRWSDNPDDFEEDTEGLPGSWAASYFQPWLGLRLDDGRFVILRKLGYGAYGTVWLARDCR